ncbi:Outer membrane protein (OmpH-like) [Catalinimonas alkaloidigena]|uniref:Outer membrane protein (OmpH-like) n=2 Tax=Catalinimonas alkaloidigena TaxID=1075417 RepID=A0A1G9QPX2_9BACT|nr:Outer membrane protein (OmpH-like) [Catalinimonas alkaloidigena]
MSTYGQTGQGYIDYDKVVRTLPEYEAGQKKLELRSKILEDSIKPLIVHYFDSTQHEVERIVNIHRKMDSTEIALLNDDFRKIEKRIQNLQDYAQVELKRAREAIDARLKDIVSKKMEQFCIETGIVCLGEKEAVLYCSDCTDFTSDFIGFLER